jgi:hypothetical protein
MTPINNSDTAWLIVSDYNQENGISYEELREDVLNPEINQYHHIILYYILLGVGISHNVGGGMKEQAGDGSIVGRRVGGNMRHTDRVGFRSGIGDNDADKQ